MNYKNELKELFSKLGISLLKSRNDLRDIDIHIEFSRLLTDRFGSTLGSLLDEAVGFYPRNGLGSENLIEHLNQLKNEIDTYLFEDQETVDAFILLKIRWACLCAALLNKKQQLIELSNIGMKYHDKTDNISWHRSTNEWNYMTTQTEEFIEAVKVLKELLNEN